MSRYSQYWTREEDERYEQKAQEDDAYLERLKARQGPVVYKTYEPPTQQPQNAIMDAETSARWNKWLDDALQKFWDEDLVPEIGEAMSTYFRKRFDEEADKLAAKLRAEFAETNVKQRADFEAAVKSLKEEIAASRKRTKRAKLDVSSTKWQQLLDDKDGNYDA
jgi:hypothetical protein